MSEADEMFEKLGYIQRGNSSYIEYVKRSEINQETYVISFTKGTIMSALYLDGRLMSKPLAIEPKELQAINEKVKELGWYE